MGTQLAWVDRDGGNLEPLTTQWRLFSGPQLSPDGEQIAVVINDSGNTDIWIVDVGIGGMRRLTTSGDASAPVWTPDGARVTFASGSVGSFAIQCTRADGSGTVETLLESQYPVWPETWHADGGQLVFRESSTSYNLLVYDVQDQSRKAILDSGFSELSAALSHDGKLLAYESNRGGSYEVYVRPFPGPGPETAVSIGQSEPRFRVIGREKLFEGAHFWSRFFGASYDVHPDGRRFLVLNTRGADEDVGKINVVLNWFEELKRRVPPGER
jgi:dipeptidyl aminopeptidase/acylaminoacyl peptidase